MLTKIGKHAFNPWQVTAVVPHDTDKKLSYVWITHGRDRTEYFVVQNTVDQVLVIVNKALKAQASEGL